MGVRRCHEHALLGQPGGSVNQILRRVVNSAGNLYVVDDGKGEPCLPIVKGEAAYVQFVMNMCRLARAESADQVRAQRRCDVACSGARAKDSYRLRHDTPRLERDEKQEGQESQGQESNVYLHLSCSPPTLAPTQSPACGT